ncbi:MAG: DNA primase small subunit PriS [Candidatus Bathyarchaeota archaeon]|nr:DNA primase small subunit PriS [Candidatus Bathyarchaeota archaeon]
MTVSSRDFVYGKFSDFYSSSSTLIPSPSLLGQRELGFLLFKERTMLRHKVFARTNDLKLFLGEVVPSDVYRSSAYYENPAAQMDKKGWLGADLVFDIDADHIPTSCNKIHDEWTCNSSKCGFGGKGIAPEICPICGGRKFETKTWPCEICLKSAKDETAKLIDMLTKDFGFSFMEMGVFFSGHRGYHVHVENEAVKTLDAMARKEIVDYVLGLGLKISSGKAKGRSLKRPASRDFSLHDFGWNKHLKHRLQIFLHSATRDDLKNAGIRGKASGIILENKMLILKRCMEEGRWYSVKGIGVRTWKKLAEYAKNLESAKIDTVVTTDTHRLIRMNGTLHGKTGLRKVKFPLKNLEDFDPFKEAVAFKEGAVKVFVSNAPEFRLGEKVFGPYKRKTIELPTAAAILLICKGRAEVAS